ncbi:hypothetical protein N7532_009625 [Penicillium argentinense]|uniref:Uncharacterized protein n=1 Tax=Penicillium argentinense TaxID=1131581 RepID=A0A9W9EZU0_9EURO|nr:uncharacterized protein N7532_009625 [Penicillium argentinense]KAJ5090941.1 hypothetical protein N7532_009625 [Penicillium argentinense]
MASTRPEGNDGGAPIFDSLAKFYVSVAIIWTSALLAGSVFLFANRHEQCIRIRNLRLMLSTVACLHVYWILCMVAYSMGGKYPCVAEYWVMSIYLPLGIALFQANSMQLLSVFGIQEKLLLAANHPHRSSLVDRPKSSNRYLDRWRRWNLVQRTEFGIVVGMIVQVFLSLSIFLSSRKFQSFGTFSEHVSAEECRRGPEWIPSILWQLVWSWIFAPYVLWRIRNIHDIHHWRRQITCCLIAALPGSPMWFAALYSSTKTWEVINRYWVPALWFAPGIMAMEAVTIFFPCYEVFTSRKQRNRILGELQAWDERKATATDELESRTSRSQSETSRMPEIYSRNALERCLAEDSSALLRFAAAKEFSGENIIFLNYVRDWKAAWAKVTELDPEYDWKRDPQYHRLFFFKIAVEIHAACVDLNTAEFPINIESRTYSDLMDMFSEAALALDHSSQRESNIRTYRNLPDSLVPSHRKKLSSIITVEEDTYALCLNAYPHETKSIMHIEPRLSDSVMVPLSFTVHAFDQAERSVKHLVFTNTWPKFIDSSSTMSIHSKS